MKLHLPLPLRRCLCALFAAVTLSPVSAHAVASAFAAPGYHAVPSFDTTTGAVKFTAESHWLTNTTFKVKNQNGIAVSVYSQYEARYAEALCTSTIVEVTRNEETGKYSQSTSYLAAFMNQVDGNGSNYTRTCSEVDASGNVLNPGVWILSPAGCSESDVFHMRNYGDITISDSRQQFNYYKPIAVTASGTEYETIVYDYKDKILVGIVSSGTSEYSKSVSSVGFGLNISDSASFTYTRGYTAGTGSVSSGTHEYLFNNVKEIEFSHNRADGDGGLFYGENWLFCAENAENVRFVSNSSGGAGSIGYGFSSSVGAGLSQGRMQYHNVSGEVLFEGNDGSCLFYNVCTQFEDINRLTFRDNHCSFFRGYNATLAVEMLRCNEISVLGNRAESAEGLFANPNRNCNIVFTDCVDVVFRDNIYKCYLFANESDAVFTNVNTLSFSGNTALDGAAIGHGLTVTGLTDSFSVSANQATKTQASTYSALLSSKVDHPSQLTVSSAEGKHAETFEITNNRATGSYNYGFIGEQITVSDIDRIRISGNSLLNESTTLMVGAFNGIEVSGAKQINIDSNKVQTVCSLQHMFGAINVHDFDSYSFSGNTITSDPGGVGVMWTSMSLCKGQGTGKTVSICNNSISGHSNAQTGGNVSMDGVERLIVSSNSSVQSNAAPSSASSVSGIFSPLMMTSLETSSISLSGIETAEFVGNSAVHKGKGTVTVTAAGGAMSASLSLSDIGTLTFINNVVCASEEKGNAYGGAIHLGKVEKLSGIGSMTLRNNSAGGEDGGFALQARGGALHAGCSVTLTDVGTLSVTDNAARGQKQAYGGAIYLSSGTLAAQRELLISDNSATSGETGEAFGGAVYASSSDLTLSSAGNLSMARNTASGGSAAGGAVYAYRALTISDAGGQTLMEANAAKALSENGKARGGFASSSSAMTVQNNAGIRFVGNHADAMENGTAEGGAIYAGNSLTFQNNDLLVMRGNYVRKGDRVVLNAIHMSNTGTNYTGNLSILSNDGQRSEIYDSVQSRYLKLNTNAANTGTILFSGQYTEADLAALKPNYTQEELADSRRIYASTSMSVTYGELQVRDGMQLVCGTTFQQAATAQMSLHNAGISASGALTTSAVHFSGANELSSGTSLAGTTWTLDLGEANRENAVLTLRGTKSTGAITMGALTGISLEFDEELSSGTYKLISFDTSKVTWSSLSKTALSGVCQSLTVGSGTDVRLVTEGNTQTLVFDYVAPVRSATTLTWGGGNGTWQQGEASVWTGSVKDLTFRNGDSIVFDKGGSVTLIGELSPASVSVSGTSNLNLSGSGSLTGKSTLTKNGSGKLTISTANTYTGGTTLNGGTLEVANARALGSGAVTMTGGTLSGTLSGTTIQASGGDISAELTGSNSITGANFALSRALRNSGTLSLSGSFSADNLELRHSDATRVDVNGSFGAAGFAKTAFDAVTVVNGGSVINKGATVTHGSLSLELASDGVASRGGAVDLSEYLLVNGTSATSTAIHAKSATAGVTMNGGTLTVDDAVQVTATGGALVLNGGSLSGTLNNVTLTMTRGSLNTSLGGSSSLIGNHYALTKAVSNTGILRVSGSFDASALSLKTTGITHVDVNGVSGASGFTKYGDSSVTLINGGTVVNEGALIIHGNLSLTLGSDGVARAAGATVYDTYLLTSGATVTSSAVHAKAAGASITQTGGTLTVNDTATVNATGGNISLSGGTLNGTLSATSVTATGGRLAATLSGNTTLTGQNYALQSAITNRGVLTVSGSFDASALTLNTIAATHVDVNGKSGASGFAKEADHYVSLVNGGTVINQGAIVTHCGLQLTLAADGTAKSTGATDDSLYLLTGRDSVSTSAVHAKSADAAVSMTGGTLTVNDRASVSATAGVVNLNGGTLVGSLATSNDLRLNVQQTSSMEGSLTLGGGTTELHGTLNLNGTLALVSATTLDVSAFSRAGDYTLIRADDISGDMSLLSCAPTSAKMAYTLSRAGNDLKLLVSHLSENHLWGAPKGTIDGRSFAEGDTLEVVAPAAITLSGKVNQGGVTVDTVGKVTFTSDKKTPGSGFGGDGALVKNGEGLLTMNAGNTYTGGTTLNAGTLKATAVDSFGSGVIVVNGGTLDLGSTAVSNDIVLRGEATIKGDAKYVGIVTVDGAATLLAKTSFKGQTTIGTGSSLTLAPKAGMAGNIFVNGGDFIITAPKGLTLGKNQIVWLYSGSIKGQLTLGSGSWLSGRSGSMSHAPVLKGGGIDLGAESYLQMTGSKANVKFGGLYVELPGKGIVYTDADLVVNSGTVTVNSMGGYEGKIVVNSGTLKLSTGKMPTENDIIVNGTAAVVNGSTHYGNIIVDGLLAKGTSIKLLDEHQKVTLNGEGDMLGTISGAGIVDVRGNVNITGAKLTNANILLGGTLTHAKGLTLAKGQTLTLDGGSVNGTLTVGNGAVLDLNGHTLIAAPVLKDGTYDDGGSHTLTLTGAKADISLGEQQVSLLSKSFIKSDAELTVNSGTVTVNDFSTSEQALTVTGGTLKLATGKQTSRNTIVVNGTAAVVNGATHYGDIEVNGELAKGTTIKLLTADQRVVLKGGETLLGAISGAGIIDVNASIDATAAKLTAATINLNACTFTNTKGIKLAKGQTLNLSGATLNLGAKGVLSTAADSTLGVSGSNTLTGSLTLGGGELVFSEGGTLTLDGTLTLSKPVTVTGSGSITYDTLKPIKGELSAFFGDAEVKQDGNTILIMGSAPALRMAAAPLATAAEAPAPLDAAPAIPVVNPVADAMVQADWGILDAERAFMGAVNSRSQHATLLDKGMGAAWVSAFGASVRHGNQGTHHGSDGTLSGAAFGLEHAVSDTGTLGLAVGRSKNRIAATGVTHLRQETAHVALYGQKQLKHGFTADAAATYGDTETKLGAASWTQKSAALSARLTHAKRLFDATAFRTFGGLSYEATDAGSIGTVHTGSVQNLRAEVGAGATHTVGKAHLYAEAAFTGDMVRHNPTVDFDGARTHGADPGRLGVRATIGGIYAFTDTWSGTASYGIEAESRSTAHTLNIGVSKTF